MAYQLGQYNHLCAIDDINSFLTLIKRTEAKQKKVDAELELNSGIEFYNNCLKLVDGTFTLYDHYYFHGKIKKLNTEQRFYIKLVTYDDPENLEQYIETFVVPPIVYKPGTQEIVGGLFVDVDFMFTPIATFDSILFDLQRISADYISPREPVIGYQEVSKINDIITNESMININSSIIKLGVQSRPGLMLCINGEEIHLPRSGIYELKNGIILVNFLSVVAPGADHELTPGGKSAIEQWMDSNPTQSQTFTAQAKTRVIDSFTIDYMYSE